MNQHEQIIFNMEESYNERVLQLGLLAGSDFIISLLLGTGLTSLIQ